MLSCGLLLTVDRSFPGFIALWPTLAAAAIIVAGQSGSRFGVDRFLSWKPLVALGDNSYALYLWHWPVLVLALAGTGITARTWSRACASSPPPIVLAVLTTRFVEKPLREWHWPQRRGLAHRRRDRRLRCPAGRPVAVWQSELTGGRGGGRGPAQGTDPRRGRPGTGKRRQAHAGSEDHPGARGHEERVGGHRRAVHGRQRPQRPAAAGCLQNSRPDKVTKRIVVLGDSHAQQYMAALGPIAKEPRLGSRHPPEGQLPLRWRVPGAGRRVQRLQPGQRRVRPGPPARRRFHGRVADPQGSAVRDRSAAGTWRASSPSPTPAWTWSGIRDNPRFTINMPECVQKNGPDAAGVQRAAAGVARGVLAAGRLPRQGARAAPDGHERLHLRRRDHARPWSATCTSTRTTTT